MRALMALVLLICAFPALSQAQSQATNKRPVLTENTGTVRIIRQIKITLQKHQQTIEVEKRAAEKKLTRLSAKNQKSTQADREKLKRRLKILEATLKSIQRDKKKLASAFNEYQRKFGSLVSIHAQEQALGKQPLTRRDIITIEVSEPSKNAIMAEILSTQNDKRLGQIVTILIDHTGTMDASEKEYWRNLPPSIPFEHRFRLLDILATERQKLAALERSYTAEIQQLNTQHLAEWKRIHSQGTNAKKSPQRKPRGHQA